MRFFDGGGECSELVTVNSSDPTASVTWRNPSGVATPPTRQVPDVLVNATYLINMPIMKRHVSSGVTLGFKNHAGSVKRFIDFHDWIDIYSSSYNAAYNPLVDIYRNDHIGPKTVRPSRRPVRQLGKQHDRLAALEDFGNAAPNSFSCRPTRGRRLRHGRLFWMPRPGPGLGTLPSPPTLIWSGRRAGLAPTSARPLGSGYGTIDYRSVEL